MVRPVENAPTFFTGCFIGFLAYFGEEVNVSRKKGGTFPRVRGNFSPRKGELFPDKGELFPEMRPEIVVAVGQNAA